jgi:transposase
MAALVRGGKSRVFAGRYDCMGAEQYEHVHMHHIRDVFDRGWSGPTADQDCRRSWGPARRQTQIAAQLFLPSGIRRQCSCPRYSRDRANRPAAPWRGQRETTRGRAAETLSGGIRALLRERGYDADRIRALAAKKGVLANIPPRCNRSEPICFNPYLYRARNLVERFFNKIKHCRRVATRYDKLAANYLAFVQLASIRLWLRANKSTS